MEAEGDPIDLAALLAAWEARALSDDPDTQVGAALLCDDGTIVADANRLPEGIRGGVPGRLSRPGKYKWIEHGERKALFRAARSGIPTEGATLYVTWFPCCECARAAIDMGVREIVGQIPTSSNESQARWDDELAAAAEMLAEAGVSVRLVDYPSRAAFAKASGSLDPRLTTLPDSHSVSWRAP